MHLSPLSSGLVDGLTRPLPSSRNWGGYSIGRRYRPGTAGRRGGGAGVFFDMLSLAGAAPRRRGRRWPVTRRHDGKRCPVDRRSRLERLVVQWHR
jgi:hypothetical protein